MLDQIKEYYGSTLQSSDDLQTDACCTTASMPDFIKPILANIHDEVVTRYYGCGLIVPEALEGLQILDLGSGSGRDVYALSAMVGEQGRVVGVDMTDEQLDVANRHVDYHTKLYGFNAPNVSFKKGYIEKLDALGFENNSFDLIVSNCVINLSTDKNAVLAQAYRLLKPGGEIYFSDVYADRRVPPHLIEDPILYGECLSGALYWQDFIQLAKANQFVDPRLVEDRPLTVDNPELQTKLGDIQFYSATYRLFKADNLEATEEDYGQTACYLGTVNHHENVLVFDKNHVFEKGITIPINGNTYHMIYQSRLQEHFTLTGDRTLHLGAFQLPNPPTQIPFDNGRDNNDAKNSCKPSSTSSCC